MTQVAAAELTDRDHRILILDHEPEQSLRGQASWSFGGPLSVNSTEQRRFGIRDPAEMVWNDWLGSAGFGRPEDAWPRK